MLRYIFVRFFKSFKDTASSTLCIVFPTKPNSSPGHIVFINLRSDVPPVVDNFGLILVILAIVLLYISVRQFNSYNEDPNPISPSSRIIMKSIYQYSRNPMYLGMIIFQIGLGLMLSMLHISFFTVLTYFLFRYFVIAPEEKYLEQKFKQDYIEYKRKVRRWF